MIPLSVRRASRPPKKCNVHGFVQAEPAQPVERSKIEVQELDPDSPWRTESLFLEAMAAICALCEDELTKGTVGAGGTNHWGGRGGEGGGGGRPNRDHICYFSRSFSHSLGSSR